jgi:Zn-finger nucleic acid-binding protein
MSHYACPRCSVALRAVQGPEGTAYECGQCDGLLLSRSSVAMLTRERAAEVGALLLRPDVREGPDPSMLVTYLPCPACEQLMNRINFAKRSGVILDYCRLHGTWFDAGELKRAIAYITSDRHAERAERDQEAAAESRRRSVLLKIAADENRDVELDPFASRRSRQHIAIADAVLRFFFD